jgi:hypothetical protein
MTSGDVDGDEMDGMNDMDDATAEALISGLGSDADPVLSDLLGDVRVAYRSQTPAMSEALASFVAGQTSPLPAKRRIPKMRSLLTAKVAAVAASILAGTGGLAVAGALPGPVQSVMSHAASHVGLNLPAQASPRAVAVTSSNPSSGHVKLKVAHTVETPGTTPETDSPEHATPEPTDPPEACSPDGADSNDSPTTVATPTSVPCPPATPPTTGHDGSGDQNQSGDQSGSSHDGQSQSGEQNSGSQSGSTSSGDQNQSGDQNSGSQSGSTSGGDQTSSGSGN